MIQICNLKGWRAGDATDDDQVWLELLLLVARAVGRLSAAETYTTH